MDGLSMRPKQGQDDIILPITFDYSGGRREKKSTAKMWSCIILVIGSVITVGLLTSKKHGILVNLVLASTFFYAFTFFVRFILLKEGKLRRQNINLIDSDYKKSTNAFWGIYAISEDYPYICRFRNGKSGVFVLLNKDVILGKYSESKYEHDEAIADAYNICGSSNIQMCHIDYMDNIGSDDRLEESFVSLERVSNTDMKDILTDIYNYQQEQMLERVTTYDAYVFLWRGSDISAWNTLQRMLSCFMQANYRSYKILNSDSLRELTKAVDNLNEFSVIQAMLDAFSLDVTSGIVPISVTHEGTETILGKTMAEKKQEYELQQKEKSLEKEEIKKRRAKKSKEELEDDEEIDLFN